MDGARLNAMDAPRHPGACPDDGELPLDDVHLRRRTNWPAMFLRASGLVYVNVDVARWKAFFDAWDAGRSLPGGREFYGRLSHEIYHYAQFFACGYVTGLCQDHFSVVRQAFPRNVDGATLQAFLDTPQPRPAGLDALAREVHREGPDGLTPLHIIEGCARLFQARSEQPRLLPGAYLLQLQRLPRIYAPFHQAVAVELGARALDETLFLGALALEFRMPALAAPRLIALRAAGAGPAGSADLHVARAALVDALRAADPSLEHLGSARDLAVSSGIDHPLLFTPWLYAGTDDWALAVRDAVWGRRPSLQADFLGHAEVLLNGAIWTPRHRDADARADSEAREVFARMALHVGGHPEDEDDVQSTDHGA